MSHFCGLQTRLGTCRATCHTSVGPQTTARNPPINMSHLCWASDNGPEAADQYVQLLWGMRQHLGNCQATCPICVCPQTTARELPNNMSHRCTNLYNKMKAAARHVPLMWGLRRWLGSGRSTFFVFRTSNKSLEAAEQHVPPRWPLTMARKLPDNMSHLYGPQYKARNLLGNMSHRCRASDNSSKTVTQHVPFLCGLNHGWEAPRQHVCSL